MTVSPTAAAARPEPEDSCVAVTIGHEEIAVGPDERNISRFAEVRIVVPGSDPDPDRERWQGRASSGVGGLALECACTSRSGQSPDTATAC